LPKVRFGNFSVSLPANRWARIGLGVGFIVLGGFFGWLPILGYWMVPVGFIILASDIPAVRRFNRRVTVKVVGWWKSRADKATRQASRNGNGGAPRRPAKPETN
jgi:purine-cytosine permease-like protein